MQQRGKFVRVNAVALAAVLLGGTVLAACGSSSSTNTTSTTTKKNPTTKSQLSAITKAAGQGKNATFSATWTSTASGSSQTITLEQSPPKTKFSTGGGGFVLNDGTSTYLCSTTATCLKESASTNPLAGLLSLYNGSSFLSAVTAYSQVSFLRLAGIKLSYNSATYAGVASTCVKITARHAAGVTWCVSKQGVLTYWGTGKTSFTLTSYSSSVPEADLKLPVGATVNTLP